MRIVVTGAAGFIGSHLCERLAGDGHQVVGVDCFTDYYDPAAKRGNLAEAQRAAAFEFVEVDLRTGDLDAVVDGADAIVNEAALPGLRWDRFDEYLSCNLLALERLLGAASRRGVPRLVQASTSSVYGVEAVGDETKPTNPISPYGVTKLAAEKLVFAYQRQFGLECVVLRYFSIYGPRQRPDMGYHLFIDALAEGRPIKVFGDGTQSRGNTYVADCVAGTCAALDGADAGEIYNIGGGKEISVLGAIEILAGAVGVQPEIEFVAARPGDQQRTFADVSKAAEGFGYQPVTDPDVGLPAQVAWQLAARPG